MTSSICPRVLSCRFTLKSAIFAVSLCCMIMAFVIYCDRLTGFDRAKHRYFTRLAYPCTRSEIERRYGPPIRCGSECLLPQREGYEDEFAAAQKFNTNAGEFCLWQNGMNIYYCVGFDSAGKFVGLVQGGS